MSYAPDETDKMIDDIAKVCDIQEEWVVSLKWEGKGNTPTFPWPDIALHLGFTDAALRTFEIMPFEKQLPETAKKVTLSGNGLYRTITRADLEVVLKDFLTTFGSDVTLNI